MTINCNTCRHFSMNRPYGDPCTRCTNHSCWEQKLREFNPDGTKKRSIDDATPEEWSAVAFPSVRADAKPADYSWPPKTEFTGQFSKDKSQRDGVDHPSHYTAGTIECIEYMEDVLSAEEYRGYLRGQVIKYQHRLMLKGSPGQDAAKLAWYAEKLAQALKNQ